MLVGILFYTQTKARVHRLKREKLLITENTFLNTVSDKMDSIAEPWDTADDVRAYSNYDLQYSRDWSTRMYDKNGEIRAKVTAYLKEGQYEVTNESETLDMAYRIGCADMLDSYTVPKQRPEFDLNYCIPPRGWVDRTVFRELDISEPVEPESDNKYLQVSTPSVCDIITDMLIKEDIVEHKRDVCLHGLDIMVGRY